MVPVPEALEMVLTEAAKSLWSENGSRSNIVTYPATSLDLIGQMSASDIQVPHPGYPNYNSSIMDGYAIKTGELGKMKKQYDEMDEKERLNFQMIFSLEGKVFAGDNNTPNLDKLTSNIGKYPSAVYVTTGAVVPDEYDAVIPIEDTIQVENGQMRIVDDKVSSVLGSTAPWTWIRPIGCDITAGSIVLSEGERIQPVHMALLAQCGVDQIPVKYLPKIGLLSTGNELLGDKDPFQHGRIPDANRPLLLSQLSTYGNCKPHDLGIVSDDDSVEVLSNKLTKVLWTDGIDIIISTGGISMGEKDNMEEVFVEGMGGEIHFGRMNMKPGKPTTFITIDKERSDGKMCRKLIFALPGNPVSASVCTELLVRPCLDLLHYGVDTSEAAHSLDRQEFIRHSVDSANVHCELMATLTADVNLDKGRPEYHRVSLQMVSTPHNKLHYSYNATSTGVQRSSRVLSLRRADGLMMLPRGGKLGCGQDVAKKGQAYPVLLYKSSSYSTISGTRFGESMHKRMMDSKGKSSEQNIHLGLFVCSPEEAIESEQLDVIESTLVDSLRGENEIRVVNRSVVDINGASYDSIEQRLNDAVCGSKMNDANVIFVVVLGQDSNSFRIGLDISHALRRMTTKHADAMAMRWKKAAASEDPLASLFENVVGLVGDSRVLISCSDRGVSEAGTVVRGSLYHLIQTLKR